jgi:ABC-type uncharacterized transport system ATPase subunit
MSHSRQFWRENSAYQIRKLRNSDVALVAQHCRQRSTVMVMTLLRATAKPTVHQSHAQSRFTNFRKT